MSKSTAIRVSYDVLRDAQGSADIRASRRSWSFGCTVRAVILGVGLFHVGSRPVTPVGMIVMVALAALLVVTVTRSQWWLVVVGVVGAYTARRIGLDTGFVKWLDHRMLERLSETFDNVEGWLIGLIAAVVVFVAVRPREPTSMGDDA
jgi:hypothetical protein